MDIVTVGILEAAPAGTMKTGHDSIPMTAGKSLKIETSPDGEEVLDIECPAGKAWSVRLDVTITETDV